jgi:hypothetical protein
MHRAPATIVIPEARSAIRDLLRQHDTITMVPGAPLRYGRDDRLCAWATDYLPIPLIFRRFGRVGVSPRVW